MNYKWALIAQLLAAVVATCQRQLLHHGTTVMTEENPVISFYFSFRREWTPVHSGFFSDRSGDRSLHILFYNDFIKFKIKIDGSRKLSASA